jgi:hypothetical protein
MEWGEWKPRPQQCQVFERGTCSIPTPSTISNSALSDATIMTEEED